MKISIIYIFILMLLLTSCVPEVQSPQANYNNNVTCPNDFVFVSGDYNLNTQDFCVMKYEARVNESNQLIFDVNQFPKTSISYSNAYDICKNHTDGKFSGSFSLISNPEWMTIAREIENNPKNWSSEIVGSGMLAKGHSDAIAFDYKEAVELASVTNITDLNDYYNQTGNSALQEINVNGTDLDAYNGGDFQGESIYGLEQKRIHFLKSGEKIWDLSGNATEYVDWDPNDEVFTFGPTDAYVDKEQVTSLYGSMLAENLSPLGNYDSTHGMGKWVMRDDSTRGVTTRGGHVRDGSVAGVYSLSTTGYKTDTGSPFISFRCVYRP